MLESTYLLVIFISFSCLIISFFNKKRFVRIVLQAISMALFGTMAMASAQVENFDCESVITLTNSTNITYSASNNTITTYNNDILCEKNKTFDEASVWVLVGMTLISAAIAFLTAVNALSMRQED